MEAITLKQNSMKRALNSLKEGLDEIEIPVPGRPIASELMSDGVTQRFEYCIDAFWKFLKIYFEDIHKITVEKASPRIILVQALDLKIINKIECDILLDGISDRNLTSHVYDEETAREIFEHIPMYYTTMKKVIYRLQT